VKQKIMGRKKRAQPRLTKKREVTGGEGNYYKKKKIMFREENTDSWTNT